ncbi:hypothetical protein NVV78_05895 [Pediococcus ethanolidurans]|uniref:sunset domain-containing protein n=1 Tax=Pediococcus ethanolidurans TaxID=319653 RepID=UPI0021E9965F|nr:Ada metal-binding domain-containing protein [Pediococcus ethanolidurans]MCV3315475.1 hypothetical protein [Pediococcus ethanolidurans]
MNTFFALLILGSVLGFIILEIISLYNKITHKFLFHVPTNTYKNYVLGTLLLFCVAIFGFQSTDPKPANTAPPVKKIYKTKTVGKAELNSAKLRAYELAKISSKVSSQSESVEELSSKVTAAKKTSSKAASLRQDSESRSESLQSSESVRREKAASESESAARTSSSTSAKQTSTKNDLDTTTKQKIIGNKNSKIYHVPGQAGYHMNSQNAVYFQTEAEAQAAGYRKAKR